MRHGISGTSRGTRGPLSGPSGVRAGIGGVAGTPVALLLAAAYWRAALRLKVAVGESNVAARVVCWSMMRVLLIPGK
jgi:hypothetical protein